MTNDTNSMTFAAAQISVARGNIEANLQVHFHAMEAAAAEGVDILIFPELSVTGYEMDLAEELQASPDDAIFEPLQAMARKHAMFVSMGMPLRAAKGKPYLGAVILGGETPLSYAKVHVHHTEAPYFQPGLSHVAIPHNGANIGCAICADLTNAEHAAKTHTAGADVYAAGALINAECWEREEAMLQSRARNHGMTVVFANHAARSGPYTPVGNSSIWAPSGELLVQAHGCEECLVIARKSGDTWQRKIASL